MISDWCDLYFIHLPHLLRVDDAPLDPAGQDDDGLALLEVGVPGLLDLGHPAADHGEGRSHPHGVVWQLWQLSNSLPHGVGPHVGVHTEEQGAELDLILLKQRGTINTYICRSYPISFQNTLKASIDLQYFKIWRKYYKIMIMTNIHGGYQRILDGNTSNWSNTNIYKYKYKYVYC